MPEKMDLEAVQESLRQSGCDGWLFYDFHRSDPIAYRLLGIPDGRMTSRRWFYLVPATGAPVKIVHRIEPESLEPAPGEALLYAGLEELDSRLDKTLKGLKKIAMQYSPGNAVPYISRVDAGTVEMVRARGVEVVSSADLVQTFEATMNQAQLESHLDAVRILRETVDLTFAEVRRRLLDGVVFNEYEIQQFMASHFTKNGFVYDHPPIVAVNENSGNPHYGPEPGHSKQIKKGDHFLIDLWCKKDAPLSIYADITWTAFLGTAVPEENQKIFQIVSGARDAAAAFALDAFKSGRSIRGCEVDDVCRDHIAERGYGEYFIHRTGHSLGEEVHGNGANIDHFETRDERRLIPRTAFTIEPGVYLPSFGVRSEIDLYIAEREGRITGEPIQKRLEPILA
ncbi:MAG TPA: M24 family metallopeptidase [Candidatus Saccharimonadales bacterium]|nr:M24 family metallopeptidase [Candidatus Saccharimonadales bacterium]